jgi:hypothetical protein
MLRDLPSERFHRRSPVAINLTHTSLAQLRQGVVPHLKLQWWEAAPELGVPQIVAAGL